ncbi:MAG: hypothetical protein JJE27_07070, partial [Thermoleophilia bacterium]|nr:hypothetical protein [Thermoleophilia bacterium]
MTARAANLSALRAYAPKLTIALLVSSLLAGAFAGGADARRKGKTKQARAAAANVGVSILTPAPGSVLTGDARWRVKAFSRDGIKNVRFYIDDRLAWLEGQDPWY